MILVAWSVVGEYLEDVRRIVHFLGTGPKRIGTLCSTTRPKSAVLINRQEAYEITVTLTNLVALSRFPYRKWLSICSDFKVYLCLLG